jgi:hypothetical protein
LICVAVNATKILWGQITLVFSIVLIATWAATQWTAWRLGYQQQLGPPWFELSIRGDIIKTMHRTMTGDGREPDVSGFAAHHDEPSERVLGRLIAHGLHDELHADGEEPLANSRDVAEFFRKRRGARPETPV